MLVTRREALAVLRAGALSALAGCGAATPARVTEASGTRPPRPGRCPAAVATHEAGRRRGPRLVVALHGKGGSADDAFDSVRLGDQVARTGLPSPRSTGPVSTGTSDAAATPAPWSWTSWSRCCAVSMASATPHRADRAVDGRLWRAVAAVANGPTRAAAVAAESAALWRHPGDSAPGASDDREDFRGARRLPPRESPGCAAGPAGLWHLGPVHRGNRALATAVLSIEATFDAGGHTSEYWAGHADAQMTWLAAHLTG